MRLARYVSVALAIHAFLVQPVLADTSCFRRNDNAAVSYEVFQLSPPPDFVDSHQDFVETSPYYPATAFATSRAERLTQPLQPSQTQASFQRHYFHWVNRCVFIPGITPGINACHNTRISKGNLYVGIPRSTLQQEIRPLFSTYDRADGCTLAQVGRVVGQPEAEVIRAATALGLTVVPDGRDQGRIQQLARDVVTGNGSRQTAVVDVCILDPSVLARDAQGVMLDYEVWDNRAPGDVVVLFQLLRNLTARYGKSLFVNTNPVPRVPNGLVPGNLRQVLETVDVFMPTLTSGATPGREELGLNQIDRKMTPWQNYQVQLMALTNDGRTPLTAAEKAKLVWNVSLFDISLDEARQLHDEFVQQQYRGIMLFRNLIKEGGKCSRPENQVIACLTLGQCHGHFGVDRK